MKTLLQPLLAALCLVALSAVAAPAAAQIQSRAYAPDDLRELSYDDQIRVISLEYEEQSGGRRIPDDQLRFYLDQVNRSNWTFSRIKQDIAQSLRGSAGPAPWPGAGGSIRCESREGRSRTCATPWPGRSRLARQLSDTRCVEGRNWSSRFGEVSVWGGCRGEFVPDAMPGPIADQPIRCESVNKRTRTCPTPWPGRSQLVRELSNTQCVEGHNWESRRGQVTVWGGCRAEFAPLRGWHDGWHDGGHDGGGYGYSVTCSSDDGRYTTCHWAPGQGRPHVIEQLSREPCIRGSSWGMVDHNTIWVSRGCRARFGN